MNWIKLRMSSFYKYVSSKRSHYLLWPSVFDNIFLQVSILDKRLSPSEGQLIRLDVCRFELSHTLWPYVKQRPVIQDGGGWYKMAVGDTRWRWVIQDGGGWYKMAVGDTRWRWVIQDGGWWYNGVFGTHWASGSNQWPSGRFDLRVFGCFYHWFLPVDRKCTIKIIKWQL